MEQWAEYVTSVIAAALVCGLVLTFLQSGTIKELVKLICGLFLAFAIIQPVMKLELSDFTDVMESYTEEAGRIAQEGQAMAKENEAAIIKSETEAYIQDKAASLRADVHPEVTLSDEELMLPVSVRITGEISPYARGVLAAFMESELGIAKENQQWIG